MNVSTSLSQLQPHEHQMRTVYDLDKLAELLLSVYTEGGIRAWQPIAAANDDGSYRLIHGHRRWLALIFGAALPDWLARQKADGSPVEQVTVETGRIFLTQMVEHFDNLLSAGLSASSRHTMESAMDKVAQPGLGKPNASAWDVQCGSGSSI